MENNPIKTKFDIDERNKIIDAFRQTRHLDREHAIRIIVNKRMEDEKVAAVTAATHAQNATIPLDMATDESLIQELQLQVITMEAELAKMVVSGE